MTRRAGCPRSARRQGKSMKKLLTVIAWTLALNFLAAVGGIAWLYSTKKLDRDKVHQIKDLVFAPATQPVEVKPEVRDATTQPTLRLEEMMAKVSGRSASEQVEFMQNTFNTHMALLDRRFQDLQNQRKTIYQAKTQLDKDRQKLLADQKQLATAQQDQTKLLTDQGFQDTLNLYNSMPPRQVKTSVRSIRDDPMIKHLRGREPRIAA